MKAKRIFAFLLASLMLTGSLAACSESGTNEDTTASTDAAVTTPEETTEPAETRLDPGLPADMKMDGYTITFFGKNVDGVYVEEETGDIVNDAVFRRNLALNEEYDFNVEFIAAGNQEYAATEAKQTVQAGDDAYQVLMDGGNRYVEFIQAGLLYDLNNLKYQNFEQPWWYKYLNEGLSIKNKLYMTASSFMLTTKQQLYGTVINRKIAEDNGVDMSELYQLARDGKWTIDKFAELTKLGNADLNGDGKRDQNDQWGLQMQAYCGYSLAVGCGFRIAEKNADDIPEITAGTERSINLWDTLVNSMFSDKSSVLITQEIAGVASVWTAASEMWKAGQVLVTVGNPAASWRELEYDYSLLPSPKFDEEQAEYYHTGSSWNTPLLSVPVTTQDPEKVSFILEAMSYTSYYDVLPVFYENYLQTKLLRDRESVEMLEIIQNSPYFDIGAVFNWGDYLSHTYTITRSGVNNLATIDAKLKNPTNKLIEKFISTIEKNAQQ